MRSAISKLVASTKGAFNIASVVVNVVLVTALIPVVAVQIANATNLTSTEETLLGLTTLFIILGLIVSVAKTAGLFRSGEM